MLLPSLPLLDLESTVFEYIPFHLAVSPAVQRAFITPLSPQQSYTKKSLSSKKIKAKLDDRKSKEADRFSEHIQRYKSELAAEEPKRVCTPP